MKKIISAIMSATIALSSFAALAVTANAGTDDGIIYSNTFDSEASINDFTIVGSGSLSGNAVMSYDSENNGASIATPGSKSNVYLLPENVNVSNFIMEADYTFASATGYIGFCFGYQDASNANTVVYQPSGCIVQKKDYVNGSGKNRNMEKGRGVSVAYSVGDTVRLKLIVNEGLMEFFINNELCYTYYSPDDSRKTENYITGNYKQAGRLGIFSYNTAINVDNITVKNIASEGAIYSNAFSDSNIDVGFAGLDDLNSLYGDYTFTSTNWGVSNVASKNGWGLAGAYIPTKVSGNYAVDVNFSLEAPGNASRFFGVMFGINDDASAVNVAAVRLNGGMFIQQWDGTGARISGSKTKEGDYTSTIPENKQNTDTTLLDKDTSAPLLSYFDANYPKSDAFTGGTKIPTTNNRRHNLHIDVIDGVATMTFEGQTITCEIDANDTDGYIGLFSRATNAYFYSIRVTQLPETPKTPSAATEISVVEAYKAGDTVEDKVVEGDASLLEFAVNANDYAVSKITIAPGEGEAKVCTTTLAAGANAVIGIIVNGLYVADNAAANSLFTVTVE